MYDNTAFSGNIKLFSTLKRQERLKSLTREEIKKLDFLNPLGNEVLVLVFCKETKEEVWLNVTDDIESLFPDNDIFSGGFIKRLNNLFSGKRVALSYCVESCNFELYTPLYAFMT